MLRVVRRYLVLIAWMFWQGGFTFYAGVVVPIGTQILGSAAAQGWITRRVSLFLNLAGAVAVLMLGLDIATARDPSRRRFWLRWLTWIMLAITLGALVWLHPQLDALLDPDLEKIMDRRGFRPLHKGYLWTSTVQWGAGLLALFLTLRAWQGEDGRPTHPSIPDRSQER
jgi:hypothetical protein